MAVDNKQIAEEVLKGVGGKENVKSATHCMTRLRLTFNDNTKVNDVAIKAIKGVLGINWAGEQLQVIIGQNVPKVYDAVVALGVAGGGSVDENLDDAPKEKLTAKTVFNKILDYCSGSMVPLIPLLMGGGLFRTVAAVLGPTMLGLLSADDPAYIFLYTTLYEASFYFMPIYLGYTAAKKIGATPVLGLLAGGVLIAPTIVQAATDGTAISVYGLQIVPGNYTQSVLPVLLTIPVLYVIEKFMKKHVPDVFSTMFTPWFTMIVTIPIELIILAPLGNLIGQGIANALFGLADVGGVLSGIMGVTYYLAGGASNFLVITNYFQGGTTNIICAAIGMAVSCMIAALVTYITGFTKEDLAAIDAEAESPVAA